MEYVILASQTGRYEIVIYPDLDFLSEEMFYEIHLRSRGDKKRPTFRDSCEII